MRASSRIAPRVRLATAPSRPLTVRPMSVSRERAFQNLLKAQDIGSCFKVVTYNILADKYATSGWHKYAKDEHLDWGYRHALIQQELQHYNADLLCMQEVDESAYHDQFVPWFQSHGFGSLYMARQSIEVAGPAEGIALFYRTSVFQLRASDTRQYTDMIADHCPLPHPPYQLVNRQEGLALALLHHLPTDRTLLAACTHLFWNPQYPQVKALQAHLMCARIRQFLRQHQQPEDTPVVVGGDFNSLWRKYSSDYFDKIPEDIPYMISGVYQLLSSGKLSTTHPHHPHSRPSSPRSHPAPLPPRAALPTPALSLATLPVAEAPPAEADEQLPDLHSSGLKLQSAHMAVHSCEPPLTTRTGNFSGCLDYIWFTPASLQVVGMLDLPYPLSQGPDPLCVVLDPLPNEHFPSDHIAMGCTLQLL